MEMEWMETIVCKISETAEQVWLKEAGEILAAGGLVGIPTETVYGLAANALDAEAAAKIYAAKGRPSDNPLIVHISDISMLEGLVSEIPDTARKLAEKFWPGPLTMIFPKSDVVPYGTTGGLDTVAVRMPSHPVARKLIGTTGIVLAAPSANTSGRPSPTRAEHVYEDLNGKQNLPTHSQDFSAQFIKRQCFRIMFFSALPMKVWLTSKIFHSLLPIKRLRF